MSGNPVLNNGIISELLFTSVDSPPKKMFFCPQLASCLCLVEFVEGN